MKKLIGLSMMLLFVFTSFAQDLSAGMKAKNDGNEAYRNKNYVSAIKNWEKYLASGEEGVAEDQNTKDLVIKSYKYAAQSFYSSKKYTEALKYFNLYLEKGGSEAKSDGKTAYAMAITAYKLKKNDLALSYYQKSIDLDYKADASMLYMANIYKNADDEAKMTQTLIKAMEKYPDSKYHDKMASMLTVPMLKDAAIPFSEANELAKAASSADPNSYVENMGKAVAKFKEAIPLFEKVLKYDPSNDQAKTYINACNENIKAFNNYKTTLKK